MPPTQVTRVGSPIFGNDDTHKLFGTTKAFPDNSSWYFLVLRTHTLRILAVKEINTALAEAAAAPAGSSVMPHDVIR